MNRVALLSRYLPLAFGVIILVVIIFIAPWGDIAKLLRHISLWSLLAMLVLSLTYYGTKVVRFWYMLRSLNLRRPLPLVALIYMSAQPVSLLPAGELYRTVLLERYANIPVAKSAPTVTLQGLVEACVLIGFSLASAFVLGEDRVAVLIVAALVAALMLALQQGWLRGQRTLINRLPFVNVSATKFESFVGGHERLLGGRTILVLVLLSLVPVLSGIGIFAIAANALGTKLTLAQAAIGYCLPVVVSGLSFLPGGLGVNEGGSIGILRVIGVSAAAAIAITLLLRIFTLGAGLVYGLIAMGITRLTLERQ